MEHAAHGHAAGAFEWAALAVAVAAAVAYAAMAIRERRRRPGWSHWRTAAWLCGCALSAVALLPEVLPFASGDFRQHMLQHLLLGMVAPLGLVLGAPVTLLLRSVPRRTARLIVRLLHSTYIRIVSRPEVALLLNVGGMAALYFTPLYETAAESAFLHALVHVHFLLAGYLFAWVIAGPDPAPRRPSVPYRIGVLGVAIAVHATLAQLMYAGVLVAVDVPAAELRGAAEIMYYGGDVAELLLAFALVSTWRPRRRSCSRASPRITTGAAALRAR